MNKTLTLREWMATTQTRLMAIAIECGVAVTTVSRWAAGQQLADADMVERIERFTAGAVTAADMHAVRLAWLKAHRPEKFSALAVPPSVAFGDTSPPLRGVADGCAPAEAAE